MSQQQPQQQQPQQQQPQQQQSPTGDSASLECGLEAAMASTGITSRDEASGPVTIAKGPKKTNGHVSKSEGRLHGPMQPHAAYIPASLPPGYVQSQSSIVSPTGSSPMPQLPQPFYQPDYQPRDPEENDLDFLGEFLGHSGDNGVIATGYRGGPPVPSGTDEVFISPPSETQSTMPSPQPPPPSQQPQTPHAAATATAPGTSPTGRPVSEETRRALINRLRPQTAMVDENFNTPLHTAVIQNETKEQIDFLLSDLKSQKKLATVINLMNNTGHTPLSLCLKCRRPDLVPMLLIYDAAPTQLCGSASERTNHFHYAMGKCLDNSQSLQLVTVFINAVCKHCPMDLSTGLLSKNRFGKTAMDYLWHKISRLSNHQDPASVELLKNLQTLYTWLNSQLGIPC